MPNTVPPETSSDQTTQLVARVRRLMVIAALTMSIGIGAVFIVIGYRVFHSEGSVQQTSATATLPKGARIVSTAVAGDRIVLTLDVAGLTEIRTFDASTLQPTGRLTFVTEP